MATIRARAQADGTTRYTAVVRLRKDKTVIHQEYKTFAHRSAAASWAKHREVELENPAAFVKAQTGSPTLGASVQGFRGASPGNSPCAFPPTPLAFRCAPDISLATRLKQPGAERDTSHEEQENVR